MKKRLIYALHSGKLFGTERMSLATCEGLRDGFETTILAPPGEALGEAHRLGFTTAEFTGSREFARKLRRAIASSPELVFVATGVSHSLIFSALNAWYRRPARHIHVVHGGTEERLSYGRKKRLNRLGVTFVAVSSYVRERLVEHGVRPDRIHVVENFLSDSRIAEIRRRGPIERSGVQRAAVVSRIDPIKRVDLLLDALDCRPELRNIQFSIFGSGWELESLSARAARTHPNVRFEGFCGDVEKRIADFDALVHLCPVEPFGLAILEAMAAGVPVLVPDAGGAGSIVDDGVSGLRFRANDHESLASRLLDLQGTSAARLGEFVHEADQLLATRFDATARTQDYRRLFEGARPCRTEPTTTPSLSS